MPIKRTWNRQELIRKCPTCPAVIVYTTYGGLKNGTDNKAICKDCSDVKRRANNRLGESGSRKTTCGFKPKDPTVREFVEKKMYARVVEGGFNTAPR